jgi:hypothetical protein
MPTPLENARRRLSEILAEAEEIEQFIAMYGRFEDDSESRPTDQSGAVNPREPEPVDNGDNSAETGNSRLSPAELAQVIERIIGEIGRPMTRGDIVKTLELRGIDITAKDKPRYIGTLLWRNDGTFINIYGSGYWLKNRIDELGPGLREHYSKSPAELPAQNAGQLFS